MADAAQPSPIVRKLFTIVMSAALLTLFAALYVRFTQKHRPEWGDYAYAAVWAMIGLQHLLFPNPRWSSLSRYGVAGVFFALSILFFVATIFE